MVRSALQYLRQHVADKLSIADMARNIAVGRRRLELRFRQLLGRSVLEEIHRVRVDLAKELLSDTDLPVTAVAARSGFSSIRRLDVIFLHAQACLPRPTVVTCGPIHGPL